MAESLKQKTVKGLGWSALDNAARYGMQFAVGIVLARLLSPDDYGLLGLVGIIPMLWVNIFVGIIGYFLNAYYSGRLLGYSSWMQLRDIAPSYALAIAIALPVWFLKFLPLSYWIVLPMQIAVGATVFFLCCKLFKMNEYKEIIDILKRKESK